MTYAGVPYAGGPYAGGYMVTADIPVDTEPTFSVEVSFTTDALATPAWVDISEDVRSWDVTRGRARELERFGPGRCTIVLDNSSRAYDSAHATGPWYGNLRPMRRIRIRETFSGVTYPRFDGYVDRWLLDYPEYGVDAIATVTATDGFKIFARTDLGISVYANEVEADAPAIWWRLDETLDKLHEGLALNAGTDGTAGDGTLVAEPGVGAQTLIVLDPGSAWTTVSRNADRLAVVKQGATIGNASFNLLGNASFSTEVWLRVAPAQNQVQVVWFVGDDATNEIHGFLSYDGSVEADGTGRLRFVVGDVNAVTFYGVQTPSGSIVPEALHHVVAVVEASGQMAIYLDGTRHVAATAGVAGTSLSGVTRITDGNLHFAHDPRTGTSASNNWHGTLDEFAIYETDLGATRVSAHYAAGTAPWQGDLPGARADRVLDLADWPDDLRELDAGQTTFQSAELGPTVLEHLHKVSETEFGNMFVTRAGVVRLIARDPLDDRVSQGTFGDGG